MIVFFNFENFKFCFLVVPNVTIITNVTEANFYFMQRSNNVPKVTFVTDVPTPMIFDELMIYL